MATAVDETHIKTLKHDFNAVVNMSAAQLEKWLRTDESKSVGQTKEGDD